MNKKLILLASAAILSLGAAGESWAETYKCGDNCWATYSNGTLTVKGTGPMNNYSRHDRNNPAPWMNYKHNITKVVVEEGITTIGNGAFDYFLKLTDVSLPDTVTSIGYCSFADAYVLKSIELPESLTTLDQYAFIHNHNLESIVIPDNVKTLNTMDSFCVDFVLETITIPDTTVLTGNGNFCKNYARKERKFICKGTKGTAENKSACDEMKEKLAGMGYTEFNYADETQCNSLKYYYTEKGCIRVPNEKAACQNSDNYYYNGAECVAYHGGEKSCARNYLAKESECISKAQGCGANYKDMGKWCNRVRYTPAEAAAVANDDNTNVVTITFRK